MKFRKFVYSLLFTSGVYATDAELRSDISSSQNVRVVPFTNGSSTCCYPPEVMRKKAEAIILASKLENSRNRDDSIVPCIARIPMNLIKRNVAVLMMLSQQPLFPDTPIQGDYAYQDGFLFDDRGVFSIGNQFLVQLNAREQNIEISLGDLLTRKTIEEECCKRLKRQQATLEIETTETAAKDYQDLEKTLNIGKERIRLYDLAIQKKSILLEPIRRKIDAQQKAEKDFSERYEKLSVSHMIEQTTCQILEVDDSRQSFVDSGRLQREKIISDQGLSRCLLYIQYKGISETLLLSEEEALNRSTLYADFVRGLRSADACGSKTTCILHPSKPITPQADKTPRNRAAFGLVLAPINPPQKRDDEVPSPRVNKSKTTDKEKAKEKRRKMLLRL